ncbi:elongation factor P [Lyticum sinuosum]|uniref:Elongation factor P n=1 Tax=Lyticum sinuosum TaxID=1332059 RepID=A0AAE4VM56_9RICK|nr:elongation factor P [Lyticum sinuosum]MDZ5761169.1 Elongation factor P [Lyticum sinuosum]
MQINANDIRIGNIIDHDNRLWLVLKTMHTQPGKGGAYMQVEMKDIKNGTKINIRYRSSETISKAALNPKDYQILYTDNNNKIFVAMDNNTFEQINLNIDLITDEQQRLFIEPEMNIIVEFYNNTPIIVKLPTTVIATVKYCETVIKGQTAAASYKPATLSNGVRIMVPPFIESGERIIVKIEGCEYIERVKK